MLPGALNYDNQVIDEVVRFADRLGGDATAAKEIDEFKTSGVEGI